MKEKIIITIERMGEESLIMCGYRNDTRSLPVWQKTGSVEEIQDELLNLSIYADNTL